MKNLVKNLLLFTILSLPISFVRGQSTDAVYQQAKALYDEENYESSFPLMLKAAKNNHAEAQAYVGLIYGLGQGRKIDYQEAVKWYEKSAKQGNDIGQYNLGIMYSQGKGVKRDYNSAIYYFREACEQNNPKAFGGLGYMFENDLGCTKKFPEAIKLYQKGARLGDKWAQDTLTELGYSW